ncbi:hypothetical protein KILIM_161_00020, partial [Kineosphaera limosa NBRC 100340]
MIATPGQRIPRGTVSVVHGGRSHVVPVNESVSFGRGRNCAIQLEPDDFISRHAGDIEVLADRVIVWNRSASRPLHVRSSFGPDVVVEAGGGYAPPLVGPRLFDVLVLGRAGLEARVHVNARALCAPSVPAPLPGAAGRAESDTQQLEREWRPSQRRVLAALCEPLLTQ